MFYYFDLVGQEEERTFLLKELKRPQLLYLFRSLMQLLELREEMGQGWDLDPSLWILNLHLVIGSSFLVLTGSEGNPEKPKL